MLFSEVVQSYRCPDCEVSYSNSIPTSIIPLLFFLVSASAIWSELLFLLIGDFWRLYLWLSFVIALVSIPIAYIVVQQIVAPWADKLLCPACKVNLEVVGGGFVDGGFPSKEELFIYLILIGIPTLSLVVHKEVW